MHMNASKRTTQQNIHKALRGHTEVRWELDRLEKAANEQVRKTLPQFRYPPGEVTDTFLGDLADVVSRGDWRPAFERTADRFKQAAKHIRKALGLVEQTSKGCPTYDAIPITIWESTADAGAVRRRIAALPRGERLFGVSCALQALIERIGRRVIDPRKTALDFRKAMMGYAAQCDREAERLKSILKVRDRRFDRLGPILELIRHVESLTGRPHDGAVARLLAYAYEIAGRTEQSSPDAIRKLRKRYPAS